MILFRSDELDRALPRQDPRAGHVLHVLRRKPGETFDVGLINGQRGKATLQAINADALSLSFAWDPDPPPEDVITLIVGLPRPQTARDILRDATSLGVAAIHFVATEKSDPNYAQSSLWTSAEWQRRLVTGAEQAFATRIPAVTCGQSLLSTLAALPPETMRLALDNYEADVRLGEFALPTESRPIVAIGGERGWGSADRAALRAHSFRFTHLGQRVLRTETAVVAALAIVRNQLKLM